MKIKTRIGYEESYLPKRCRKIRYRECEEYVYMNLKEVGAQDLKLAFEDNSYEGAGKIYFYNSKLWKKSRINPNTARDFGFKNALEYLVWANENGSAYCRSSHNRIYFGVDDTSKDAVIKEARKDMRKYILVDGELYERTAEPRYVINTFGLGHNHGGTGMFCEYFYNPNICKDNYFSALQGEQAVAYANMVAANRGDTESVGRFKPFIAVHMPELVKVKPRKQHGNGNKTLNDMENIIRQSEDVLTAGLLCVLCSV